jgi:cell volume regulation protein A
VATALDRFTSGERVLLSWAGLRGAVPVVLATFPVIDQVEHSGTFFNIVFFAVVISTLFQGTTVEWLARKLGVTTSEPALPRPLVETGTVRRLGAEIVEYPVGPDDAIVGQLVRELGLPRDALLSVIVRGEEALLPRGSTRIEADDRLHVMVREEVAEDMDDLLERWRVGPVGLPARYEPKLRSGSAVFTTRTWTEADGDAGFPKEVGGVPVAEQIRTRRDVRGALVMLVDGRFAVTGPLLAVGGPLQLQRYARRRPGSLTACGGTIAPCRKVMSGSATLCSERRAYCCVPSSRSRSRFSPKPLVDSHPMRAVWSLNTWPEPADPSCRRTG